MGTPAGGSTHTFTGQRASGTVLACVICGACSPASWPRQLVWILLALGQNGSTRRSGTWAETSTFNTARLIEPAVYLAAAGIGLGVLATLRWSPLGPLVAGLLLMAPYVGMFIAPLRVRSAVPGGWRLFGDPLPLRLVLDNGTLFFLGLLLVMAAFSVQRWRRWPVAAAGAGPVRWFRSGRHRPGPVRRRVPTDPGHAGRRRWPTRRPTFPRRARTRSASGRRLRPGDHAWASPPAPYRPGR